MVLGLRSKNKKGASVHVDYVIHIEEIKPWPPSQSLKSLRSVVLHWENEDRNSGCTSIVTPNLGSGATEGRIEFNESFKIEARLLKEGSSKGNGKGAFQKNLLELNLYEPRRDKSKGQHLGSATLDLAEYGIVKDALSSSVPLSSKRSFRNTPQPLLYYRIQPLDNDSMGSSSRESLSKEVSLNEDGKESVSDLMNDEYAEEAEIASFTDDDDVSTHLSLENSSALDAKADVLVHNKINPDVEDFQNVTERIKENEGVHDDESNLTFASVPDKMESQLTETSRLKEVIIVQNGALPDAVSPCTLSEKSLENTDDSGSKSPRKSLMLIMEKSDKLSMLSSSLTSKASEEEISSSITTDAKERNPLIQEVQDKLIDCSSREIMVKGRVHEEDTSAITAAVNSSEFSFQMNESNISEAEQNFDQAGKSQEIRNELEKAAKGRDEDFILKLTRNESKVDENSPTKNQDITDDHESPIAPPASIEHILATHQYSIKQSVGTMPSDLAISSRRSLREKQDSCFTSERLRTIELSVRSPPRSSGSISYGSNEQCKEDVKEIDIQEDVCNTSTNSVTDDGRDDDDSESTSSGSSKVNCVSRVNGRGFSSHKVHELELRVMLLEAELREAAVLELGLYSIAAEHASSTHKVHTPARRLSRLYNHASILWSTERSARAARSIASGLALAAKACGNDVARLTFWLSNSIVLRAIVTETTKSQDVPNFASTHFTSHGSVKLPRSKPSPLRWESISQKNDKFFFSEEFGDWEDPETFISALEKIETWIFFRTVESVWWQTLTPCMHSGNEDRENQLVSRSKKSYGRTVSIGDQPKIDLTIKTWNRAFKDSSERLCPIRSEGLECGCLPMLARLVMEQCVARLDVAMLNAILRESDDEIPTDPVSDPICDSKVLPVRTGELSFGSGAQLKNAVGNWSRRLTDLFGMDSDDSPVEGNDQDASTPVAASFKSFHLLNALSDLLMLPKDLLLEKSIRKEVCLTFSPTMIKHILGRFLPDEFCPDPIPCSVLEALESEEYLDNSQEVIRNVPCCASSIIYSPPSIVWIKNIVGEMRSALLLRSGSSVFRKCHTSDDELEELDSPLASIITDKFPPPKFETKEHGTSSAIRYQLLREVWRDDD